MALVTSIVSWISANWQPIAIALLAIDSALIPLFPKAGILGSIKNVLSGVVPKS